VAQATVRAGEAEVAATVAQVRNDVRRGYYAVLVADARLMVLREQRDLAARARDAAQARFEAGSSPRLEVMQAELALSAAENEATAAESASVAARAQLNALLGQPLNLTPPLTGAIDEGAPLTSDVAVTMAQMASTQLVLIDRQIEAQRARIMLAEALRTPDVIPTATLTHDAHNDGGVDLGILVDEHIAELTHPDHCIAKGRVEQARFTEDFEGVGVSGGDSKRPVGDHMIGNVYAHLDRHLKGSLDNPLNLPVPAVLLDRLQQRDDISLRLLVCLFLRLLLSDQLHLPLGGDVNPSIGDQAHHCNDNYPKEKRRVLHFRPAVQLSWKVR